MIEISPLDYHVSGFRAFRICETEEDLTFHRDLPFFTTSWSEDINHRKISKKQKLIIRLIASMNSNSTNLRPSRTI